MPSLFNYMANRIALSVTGRDDRTTDEGYRNLSAMCMTCNS